MKRTVITQDMSIQEVEWILDSHGIAHSPGWEIIMAMMLSSNKKIMVNGYGHNAVFVNVKGEDYEDINEV